MGFPQGSVLHVQVQCRSLKYNDYMNLKGSIQKFYIMSIGVYVCRTVRQTVNNGTETDCQWHRDRVSMARHRDRLSITVNNGTETDCQ